MKPKNTISCLRKLNLWDLGLCYQEFSQISSKLDNQLLDMEKANNITHNT